MQYSAVEVVIISNDIKIVFVVAIILVAVLVVVVVVDGCHTMNIVLLTSH